MFIPSRDSAQKGFPLWLTDDTGTLAPNDPHPQLIFEALMALGGFQLAEAMIAELLTYAHYELMFSTPTPPTLPFPGIDHDGPRSLYEANLRRIKALELIRDCLYVGMSNPGLIERHTAQLRRARQASTAPAISIRISKYTQPRPTPPLTTDRAQPLPSAPDRLES